MAKLRWSLQAADDLAEACEYIARDSEQYARLFAKQVMRTLKQMAKERLPGSMVPEYGQEQIRERLFHSYRIIVRAKSESGIVEVIRIFHSARLLPPMEEMIWIPGLAKPATAAAVPASATFAKHF